MKKLIVSVKSAGESLDAFKRALRGARRGKLQGSHCEISFSQKKQFDRFMKNITILSAIVSHKPRSVYDLARVVRMDVSNLNKAIDFLVEVGAIRVRKTTVNGRAVKTPVVDYGVIEFKLKVA